MKKYIILGLITLSFVSCANSTELELEGRLAVKGSSVHTYLVIEDKKSHKNYKIQNKESFNLMNRQKQTVKIKAKLVKEAIGPGFPAVIEVVEVK